MKSLTRGVAYAGALCGLVVVLAACGSSSSSSSTGSGGSGSSTSSSGPSTGGLKPALNGSGEALTGGAKGGVLTVLQHGDFSHLDPGESYYALDYEVVYATQRPLYTFAPNSAINEEPNLAAGQPVISDGGKTVTVHIQPNVKFSPPVNRTVTSADVAYAIERGANPHVANPYFLAYFHYIVGAGTATGGPISGIQTPNPTTIVFHLIGPDAGFFVGALSMPLTAPVPKEFAAPLDAKAPTQYGLSKEVATGPYMLKSDSTGKFSGLGYQAGKSATLVRNPNWSASTYTSSFAPPAYVDQVNIQIGGDQNVIGRQVLQGSHELQGDPPSGPDVKLAYQQYYKQFISIPGAGVYYVALNNHQGPFANVNVRKAYWAALDREAFLKAAGGAITGQVATHFIYPTSAGFTQAGGYAGPPVDYNMNPAGNLTVAAKYMKLAGYSSGKYTGGVTIKVVGSTGDPAQKWATIANNALQQLGFHTNFSVVDQGVMYSKYCGTPKAEIDVCPNVGWIRDWSDPQTLLDVTFAGYNIVSTNNSNWGQVGWQDAPKTAGIPGTPQAGLTPIDQAMKTAEGALGATARAAAWAKVDQLLVNDAVAIPTVFSNGLAVESKDVAGVNDLWNQGSWDYEWTSLK